ncbi:MAG: hypothetical protein E6G27_07330 [Actinobacteria bacterium]|nr:MAG: hypothetical protein E6G27_07330 [Actinomycetota bacterium]
MTASLYTSEATEMVAADHRRDLLSRSRNESVRRAASHRARRLWPRRSRATVAAVGAVGAVARPVAGPPVVAPRLADARVSGGRAVAGASPPRSAAATVVDLRSSQERPVPSRRW